MRPINSKEFETLRTEIQSHPRLCGYYLINLVDITELRCSTIDDEHVAESVFQCFDDHEWTPQETLQQDQSWSDYIVDRHAARMHVIEGLVAGPPKGHLRETINQGTSTRDHQSGFGRTVV